MLFWLRTCCYGGCLSGYRSRRWPSAPNPSQRAYGASIALRRQPAANPAGRQTEPRSSRGRGRNAPYRALPPGDVRTRAGVSDAVAARSRPGRDASQLAPRRPLSRPSRMRSSGHPSAISPPGNRIEWLALTSVGFHPAGIEPATSCLMIDRCREDYLATRRVAELKTWRSGGRSRAVEPGSRLA